METVFRDLTLIDGTGSEPVRRAGLVLEGAAIRQVGPTDALSYGNDARIVDLDGRTLMPGLIDCHTHLTYHTVEPNVWLLEQNESVELNTLRAARNARAILDAGFTWIGDGGSRGYIAPAIRDAVREGLIEGPDVFAAGPILCGTAGLLDNMPAWMRQESETSLGMVVDGPEQVRHAVRRQIKGGVDWIKVAASGVAGSRFSSPEMEDLTYEEIALAVREAGKFGKRVHAHAHSREGIRAAVQAGVISLHSGEFADEETLAAMRDAGVIFSPTIAWLHCRCMRFGDAPPDARFLQQAWRAFAAARAAVPMAREMGVPIAIGTDAAHRFPHAPDGVLEMEYLVALGYTPLQAIRAACETAAAAVDPAAKRGRLAPGHRADLLVVEGNPAEDVRLLRDKRRIAAIYRDGREVPLDPARGPIAPGFRVADWIDMTLDELQAARVSQWPAPQAAGAA